MPAILIETNAAMDGAQARSLAQRVSAQAADLLQKPEGFVMVSVRPAAALCYGGAMDPAAWVEFKSIGLDRSRTAEFSEAVCTLLETEASIPSSRVYIEFKNLERDLTGWDKKTF